MASYQAVRLDGVIKLSVDGSLDLGASRGLLRDVAHDAGLRDHCLLVDLRHTSGDLSYRDVHDLVGLVEHPEAFEYRVALLERYTERFEKAQFFQAYAAERGFEVRAFLDEPAAVAWLEGYQKPER